MSKAKAIEAVRIVRKAARVEMDQAIFCQKHNFELQRMLHIEMEKRLNEIAMKLEDLLGTGYVSPNP